MSKHTVISLIVVVSVMVMAGIVQLQPRPVSSAQEMNKTESNVTGEAEKEHSEPEKLMSNNIQDVEKLLDNPSFVGEEIDTHPAQAPASSIQIIDGFKVKVPDINEAKIEANVYREQLSYTLGNMSSELLDGMLAEYQHEYGVLLTELGLQKDCSGSLCGYRIDEGAFLDALKQSGFQPGDVILSLNNTDVNNISEYAAFKKVILNHGDQLEFGIARNGEVKILQVMVHQPLVASPQGE